MVLANETQSLWWVINQCITSFIRKVLLFKKKKVSWIKQVIANVADLFSDSSSSCHWRLWTNCSWTGLNSSWPFTLGYIHSGSTGINSCLFLPAFDSSIKTETVRICSPILRYIKKDQDSDLHRTITKIQILERFHRHGSWSWVPFPLWWSLANPMKSSVSTCWWSKQPYPWFLPFRESSPDFQPQIFYFTYLWAFSHLSLLFALPAQQMTEESTYKYPVSFTPYRDHSVIPWPTIVLKVSQQSTGKNSSHPESCPQGISFQLQLLERNSPRNLRSLVQPGN